MSDFFFFTDIDLLSAQTSGNEFGPVAANTSTQYQVTSLHSSTSVPKAYAVCDGILLVQDAGTNLVNLILKPIKQPPFAFPKVKFFIYRGVQKSSIINGLEIAPSTTNDLTASLWASQAAKNNSAGTNDNPPKEAVGIDITSNGSIDDVFYRDNISFQLPIVKAGWSIGNFDPAGFGFEIMVEAIGFDPELTLVRTSNNIINVTALPGSPTQAQEFEYWHDKEAILNYIDPSAFFGSFYNFKLKVKSSDGSTSNKSKNEIYDDVLVKHINKNVVYLDIRNEYNHSINYFKNYGTYTNTDINIAYDNTSTAVVKNYYTDTWPVLRIQNVDFPSNTTNKNIIRISLPDGSGENPLPTLFISSGYLLDTYPREPKEKNKLIDLTVTSGFTNEIKLVVPNRDGMPGTSAISTYIKLKYNKRFDPNAASPPVSSGTVIRASHYMDNLFQPLAMKIPFAGNDKIKSIVYSDEFLVDSISINNNQLAMNLGMANDIHNVSLFAYPFITKRTVGNSDLKNIPLSFSGIKDNNSDDFIDYFASKNNSIAKELEFVVGGNNIEYLDLEIDSTLPVPNLENLDLENFYQLNIDKIDTPVSEWQNIQNLIQSNFITKYPVFIGLVNATITIDDNGYDVLSQDIALRGFEIISNNIQFKEVNTNIKTYSNAAE